MESKRIADYFLVLGAPFDNLVPLPSHDQLIITTDPLKLAYTPTILDRYPLTDHSAVTFPTGLTLFCLPDGLHITNSPKPPIFFSFIQTSDNGSQLYGCCLTFYEELNISQRNQLNYLFDHNEGSDASSEAMKQIKFFLPRCLCLLSQWPFVSSFKKFLCHLYRLSLSPCSIPIERYISNFINDVPAPPPGKVEVTYIIGPDSVVFRRPPSNEPTAWSSLPLSSLFECLSLQNILLVFSSLISERQVAFISSQYSLLTTCAESILSLLFPLRWTHVYIPILPRRILGVLAAPLPFFVGVHTSFFPEPTHPSTSLDRNKRNSFSGYTPSQFDGYAVFSSETVRVFLDENRIEIGSLGPPPPFPEGRAKKLMADLVYCDHDLFVGKNWAQQQLPHYDLAFYMSPRPEAVDGRDLNTDRIDEKGVRGTFLKLFVALLKDYREYLIYPSQNDPFPMQKFRTTDYIRDHPADWTPILDVLLKSQAFYQFVDARVTGTIDSDILYFDESIEAKINRYTFRLHKRDTPFLEDSSQKHTKTFVSPSVDVDNLETILYPTDGTELWIQQTQQIVRDKSGQNIFNYLSFPKLNPFLFSESYSTHHQAVDALANSSGLSTARLKRANILRISSQKGSGLTPTASPEASIYSTYLIIFSRIVSSGLRAPTTKRAPPTLSEVMNRLNLTSPALPSLPSSPTTSILRPSAEEDSETAQDSTPPQTRHLDITSDSSPMPRASFTLLSAPQILDPRASFYATPPASSFRNINDDVREEYLTIARAAIEIAFELFSVMQLRNYEPDEEVYRSLADACAVCGAGDRVILILENMAQYGILPDMQISNAVARALSFHNNSVASDTSDTHEDPRRLFSSTTSSSMSTRTHSTSSAPPTITPKDVYEAASSKDFNRLRRSVTAENISHTTETLDNRRHSSNISSYHSGQRDQFISTKMVGGTSSTTSEGFLSSPRFSTQLRMADRTLDFLYPDMVIDLGNPDGTSCPRSTCHKSLNIIDIIKNFPTNTNCYTIKCPFCQMEYVPRFTVSCSLSTWEGSTGIGTPFWCELLSPWVLQKEILNVIISTGIETIVSPSFRDGHVNPQYSVLFWNLMVYYRLYGLPYAFLITEKMSLAFLIPLDD